MATNDRLLLAQLDVSIRGLERTMRKAGVSVDRASGGMEKRWNRMASQIERRSGQMATQVRAAIAGVALGVAGREVVAYGDAWADMTNKIAAAEQISGVQARSLRDLQSAAADSRGVLEPYVDLYARLLRVSGKLAADEEQVARATQVVARAFKAGGAAASEQSAGIMQLGQALNGILGGDELRSVRENAPLLFEGIASGLGVTSDKLKDMGAAGELTNKRVFAAILKSGEDIDKAFAVTIPRGTDAAVLAMDRFGLSVGEYLAQSGAITDASEKFADVVNWAADNVETLTDALIIGAAALAGWLGAVGLAAVGTGLASVATGATAAAKALAILRGAIAFLGGPWVVAITLAAGAIAALALNASKAVDPVDALSGKLDDIGDSLRTIAEEAGASWDDIEQGARDATGAISDLERQYRDLRDAMEESGAAARQAAIDAAAIKKIEAAHIVRDADNEIAALQSQRATQKRVSTGIVQRDIDTSEIDAKIAELVDVQARAQRTVSEADATIAHLFQKTTNADFKPKGADDETGGGKKKTGRTPKTEAQLRAEFQLQEARAAGDKARVASLEDAADIERRTTAYIAAGVDAAAARVKAEAEVLVLRQLSLEKEVAAIAKTSAARKREGDLERAEQAANLRTIEQQNAIDLARLSGNSKLLAQLERAAEIERRILDYMEAGVDAAEARRRAVNDTDVAIEAEAKGKFRDTVSDAMTQAITTGNFGDAVKQVFADRASEGLRQALNSLSDVIFDLFKDVFSSANSGGGGAGGAIGDIFGSVLSSFGGGRATGGPVSASKYYEVNEGGKPELFTTAGKTYLMPGANGMVAPMHGPASRQGAGSVSVNAPLIVQGNVTEDAMPMIQRAMDENNETLMRVLPGMIDGQVLRGVSRGKY